MGLPFIPFSNCAEIVMQGQQAGQAAYLTVGVHKGSAFGGTDLSDIADISATFLVSGLGPLLHASLSWLAVKVTDLTTQFSPTFTGGSGLPFTCTGSGAECPVNVAVIASFSTVNRGRSFRGRNYVPAPLATELTNATTFDATYVANIGVAYHDYFDALLLAGFTPSILSRQENSVRRTTGVFTAIAAINMKTIIGTQRRRVAGHGI